MAFKYLNRSYNESIEKISAIPIRSIKYEEFHNDFGGIHVGIQQIALVDSIWYYWIFFIFAAIIGSIASSLINHNGNIKMCGWKGGNRNGEEGNPGEYCMGIMSDIIIGNAAALSILSTLTPQNFFQLIGLGAVAGYGGSSVLRALVNKVDAQFARQEANKSREDAEKNANEIDTHKSLVEESHLSFNKKDEDLTAIKNYLLENNKKILEELYSKNLIN